MKKYLLILICLSLRLTVSAQTEIPNTENKPADISALSIHNIPDAIQTSASEGNRFQIKLSNTTNAVQNLVVKLKSIHPNDWASNFKINETEYANHANITLLPGESNITINISPGIQKGIGRYKLKIWVNGSSIPQVKNFILIHKITNLIISNSTNQEENLLTTTLHGENLAIGELTIFEMLKTFELGLLNDLESIFFNVEEDDIAMYDDLFHYFTDFLDNGGNLFLSGHSFTPNIHEHQSYFYENYLGLNYKNESNSTKMELITNSKFCTEISSPFYIIENQHSNIFEPNQIETQPIFESEEGITGVAIELNNFKIIYLGFDINQIIDPSISKYIISETSNWFRPKITSTIDRNINQNIVTFPNPARDYLNIKLDQNWTTSIDLTITNITGQTLLKKQVSKNDKTIQIDIQDFENGIYFYQIKNEENTFSNQFIKN